jgi:hypothetical protein
MTVVSRPSFVVYDPSFLSISVLGPREGHMPVHKLVNNVFVRRFTERSVERYKLLYALRWL